MKPRQRKRLLEKIRQTLPEILEKHNKRRKKLLAEWMAWYSPKHAPPEYQEALQAKQKKRR